jgi:hypothetical protein
LKEVEMSEELSFYEIEAADDCCHRIVVNDGSDEPPFMQSITKYRSGTPMFRIVGAVILASNPDSDEGGLHWPTKAAAKKALVAARKAAKVEAKR